LTGRVVVALATAATTAILAALLTLLSLGRLSLDLGWGRRLRPLGPQTVRIDAPRERVFDIIAVPYLSPNPPRWLREKIQVLERGTDMVVAAHHTKSGRITTVTVESVSFSRPGEIRFRLLRGPVPYVTERFILRDIQDGGSTELAYSGEMGTDLWALGTWWGDLVARYWERAVADALASLRSTCESAVAHTGPREAPATGREA
jgi:polyketide cyclase/dehydrase/lipid transport protein